MSQRRRWLRLLILVGLVLALDQGSKLYIRTAFTLHESRPVIRHFFSLVYVRNAGAAFGFLAQGDQSFLRLFFPLVTVLAVVILVFYYRRVVPAHLLTQWGIGLIIGGALGNGIDRLWLGQVTDFLDVHWYDVYHWPAFNLADSAICVGVGCLLLDMLRHPTPKPNGSGTQYGRH